MHSVPMLPVVLGWIKSVQLYWEVEKQPTPAALQLHAISAQRIKDVCFVFWRFLQLSYDIVAVISTTVLLFLHNTFGYNLRSLNSSARWLRFTTSNV